LLAQIEIISTREINALTVGKAITGLSAFV